MRGVIVVKIKRKNIYLLLTKIVRMKEKEVYMARVSRNGWIMLILVDQN